MGFQLAQKLKLSKRKFNIWKKEVYGRVKDKKSKLLADMQRIDVKEENGGFR